MLLALPLAFGIEAIPQMLSGVPVLTAWSDAVPPFPGGSGPYTFMLNALLLHSVGFTPGGVSWNVPSWSISVEFFGSLAILFLIARWRRPSLSVVLAGIAVIGYATVFAIKGQLDAIFEAAWHILNLGLVRCVAGISLGALCLLFFRRHLAHGPASTATATILELGSVGAALAIMVRPEYHSVRDACFRSPPRR
jgi:peptidoglycan/LPS O-acetylase OafA/YrhL